MGSWQLAFVFSACGARATSIIDDADSVSDAGSDAAEQDAGCVRRDDDGDGWDACDGDCNDARAEVHPGVPDPGGGTLQQRVAEIEGAGVVGPAIAVDEDGAVHVLWFERVAEDRSEVRYAHVGDGEVEVERLAELSQGWGIELGLAIDARGAPHAAWTGEGLVHARRQDGVWVVDVVPFGSGHRGRFALGPDAAPHFLYAALDEGRPDLDHAWRESDGEWQSEVAAAFSDASDAASTRIDAVVSDDGIVHATLIDRGGGGVRALRREPTGWTDELAVETRSARAVAIAVGPDGEPRIAYEEETAGIGLAVRAKDGWSLVPVAERTVDLAWWWLALEVDDADVARLAYRDGGAWLATNAAGAWSRARLPIDGQVHDLSRSNDVLHMGIVGPAGIVLATQAPDAVDDVDCDGVVGVDSDGDGHASWATGGDDCDDGRNDTWGGATEVVGDGIDQDCRAGIR